MPLQFFKDPDPGITQLAWSMCANFGLTHMLLYGLTGRGQKAMLGGLLTIPFSLFMGMSDATKDYEKWKEMRVLKLRGVPDRFLPYRCKYDWTDYDKKLERRRMNKPISD
ncbi:hypothetical protein PRIPAC_71903 [Pristionchus pacificus]|uniref:Uncharacterized protein n=1 Tax=Pristionchus pacificus TaxID=54126 RepID=A0A454XI12_PRIPA|nr:hypothetical protein PRIPAC_71903 [Pristionchus pacificus]|eukprot:PDM64932.1 hypothetical protein PRIPAC_53188 [Pristionchus pacificus]